MISRKFKTIFLYAPAAYFFLFFSQGCKDSLLAERNHPHKILFDSLELAKKSDSIGYYASILTDTAYCYKAIQLFFNTDIANRFPRLVCDAYSNALLARQAFPCDLNGDNYTANVLRQVKILADSTQQPSLKTWSQYLEARYYSDIDEYLVALPRLLTVYNYFEQQNDRNGQSVTSKRLGLIYLRSYNDYSNAIYYFRKAKELYNDQVEHAKNTFFLFYCFSALDNIDTVNNYYSQIFDHPLHFSDGDLLTTRTLYQLFLFDKTSEGSTDSIDHCFSLLKKVSEPLSFYTRQNLLHIRSRYAKVLLNKKEYSKTQAVLDDALLPDTSYHHLNKSVVDLCETRFKYYEAIGNHAEAVKCFERYLAKATRFNAEDTRAKIERVKIEFENEEEKSKLKKEQEQKEAIATKQIRQEKMIRNFLIGGSVLLLLLTGVLINRNKLKRTIEMERMRNRLSRDLHDDIGSTLSSINILSRTAQDNLNRADTEKARLSLEKMNERSQRLLDNMSDIIWNIHPGNDSMQEVMSRMREYAATLLEAKNIDCTFDFPDEKTDFRFSMEVKNNIYLIFKEAVNNLSKYSRCTHATLTLKLDENNVHLKIQDNGIGFNEQELAHLGGLKNMQHRAEEIKGILAVTAVKDRGTTVELTFPRHS
ncbi:MAG TPA: sensor histidine kinase [Chitinophagales bacterium]|nr:sensor histidine kinase [Chitinophagales bacterium]